MHIAITEHWCDFY